MKKTLTSVALASALFISNAVAADETELTKAVVKLIKQYNDLELRLSGKGGGNSSDERYYRKIQFELDQLKADVAALKAGQGTLRRNQQDTNSLINSQSSFNGTSEQKVYSDGVTDSINIKTEGRKVSNVSNNKGKGVAKTEAEINAMLSGKRTTSTPKKATKNSASHTAPKATSSGTNSSAATVYVIQDKNSGRCSVIDCNADKNADKVIGDFLKSE